VKVITSVLHHSSWARQVAEHDAIDFDCVYRQIFRSMTAEYALKAMLDPHSPIRVSSAGTVALPQQMHPDVRAYLVQRGIDPSNHQQRRVSTELLHATDLVIAMSTDHQAFLVETFQSHVCSRISEPI